MKYESCITPWEIDDSEFYEIESTEDQLNFLLQYAILAPSSHNAQPWQFRIMADSVEILPDFSRRLPVVDPLDREMWMSIGAAIANLRVAAAHFGFATTVLYTADTVRVTFQETCAPDEQSRELFPAIKRRHTNRKSFWHEPLEPEMLHRVCGVVDQFPETLRLILPRDTARATDLVMVAEREQMSQPAYRDELADWLREQDPESGDGMPAEALGITTPFPGATDWVVRNVDVGPFQAARDRHLIETAAALIVVAAEDDRVSLVTAGEILEKLLLRITLEGLNYSFFNAPIELASFRDRVRSLAGTNRPPQLLLRIGRARSDTRPMPRRPVDAVTTRKRVS
jgi:hypothetical protein